jgi:hypothetical protein
MYSMLNSLSPFPLSCQACSRDVRLPQSLTPVAFKSSRTKSSHLIGSVSCCAYFIKVIRRTATRNNFSRCLFYIIFYIFFYILPLHVSAIVGHLQAEYSIILGSYFSYNGSVVYLIFVSELFKFAQITSILNVKTLKY